MKIAKKKKLTFWTDPQLDEKLSTIPEGERSFIIRQALRDYFGLTDTKKGIVGYKDVTKDEKTT